MEWSRAEVVRLITELYTRPSLWDVNCDSFKNRQKKRDDIKEIAGLFETSTIEIEKKLAILKIQYNREHLKVEKSKISGTGELYESKWFGFKRLSFLKSSSFKKLRALYGLGKNVDTRNQEVDTADLNQEANIDDYHVQTTLAEPGTSGERPIEEPFVSQMTDSYDSIMVPRRDELMVFGEYIANSLSNITDKYSLAVAKHKIHEILFDAEISQLRPSCLPPSKSSSPLPVPSQISVSPPPQPDTQDSLPPRPTNAPSVQTPPNNVSTFLILSKPAQSSRPSPTLFNHTAQGLRLHSVRNGGVSLTEIPVSQTSTKVSTTSTAQKMILPDAPSFRSQLLMKSGGGGKVPAPFRAPFIPIMVSSSTTSKPRSGHKPSSPTFVSVLDSETIKREYVDENEFE
uniref:MADF domain-containing protein n=1 Tax=Timema monikensis TaxID=170555 RepID=A0A7R9DY57_9NEOP|nr:unnamed protein product [Timema monikensis]